MSHFFSKELCTITSLAVSWRFFNTHKTEMILFPLLTPILQWKPFQVLKKKYKFIIKLMIHFWLQDLIRCNYLVWLTRKYMHESAALLTLKLRAVEVKHISTCLIWRSTPHSVDCQGHVKAFTSCVHKDFHSLLIATRMECAIQYPVGNANVGAHFSKWWLVPAINCMRPPHPAQEACSITQNMF